MARKVLALVGSGEFTPLMKEVDTYLLSLIPNPKVAIIPTAAGQEVAFDKWLTDGINHFTALGASALGIEFRSREDASLQPILESLEECNFFYLSGGDPGYLLDCLKETPAWDIIQSKYTKGAILAGASAGAMVLGKKAWARVYEFNRSGSLSPWESGLEVVPFGVLPHYDVLPGYYSSEHLGQVRSMLPTDIDIVGIDEDTAYIQKDGNWQTMGKGSVHNPASL